MTDHVFISYSAADGLDFARQLADELEGGEDKFIDVWLDKRDIDPGRDWDDQIVEGIKACKCMAFVMTKDSTAPGSMTKNEWTWALKYKKVVISLRLHEDAEQPFGLGNRQWIDFTGEFEHGLAKLRKFLRGMDSPQGKLQALKDRLADAERDLRRARGDEERRIQAEIEELKTQIQTQQKVVENPKAAEEQTQKNINAGLERERQPEKPVAKKTRTKFINPPPGIAPNYFQNRVVETTEIMKFLNDDAQRMMTIVGRGGVGKTAMVCRLLKSLENSELLEELKGKFEVVKIDGIIYLSETGSHRVNFPTIFADLSKLLPSETAENLNMLYKDPQTSVESKMNALLEHFQGERVLLLLDNFEPVVNPETQEIRDSELLEALQTLICGTHHMVNALITTRIAPRDLSKCEPGRQRVLILDEGLPHPYAENVIRERDEDGKLGLKARKETDHLLQKARKKTRGFPRALEAFVAILASDRFTTLEELLDLPLHEDVVEALVGEAFSRLDATAQKVMQALAVYNRPMTPAAVDYLLQPHLPEIDSAPVLNRLVNMHFVRRETGRYYLHPVDHNYAFDKIPTDSPLPLGEGPGKVPDKRMRSEFTQHDLLTRAADYFAKVRKPRAEWKTLEDLSAQLAEFDLRCAAGDYDTAAEMLTDFDFDCLFLWGHYRLMIDLCEKLHGNLLDKNLEQLSTGRLAGAYYSIGEYKKSSLYYKSAAQMAENIGNLLSQAEWQSGMGICEAALGNIRSSIKHYELSLSLAQKTDSKLGEGNYLVNLGNAYNNLGETRRAIEFYEHALVVHREIDDRKGEALDLSNLGVAYEDIGKVYKAIEFSSQALDIHHEIGDRRGEAFDLGNIGKVYTTLDKPRKAIQFYEHALEINRAIGDRRGEAIVFEHTGHVFLHLVEYQNAGENLKKAIQIADEISFPQIQNSARCGLAQAYLLQNELADAHNIIEAALQYDVPNSNHNASALRGIIALRQEDEDTARQAFTRAIAQADEILAVTPEYYEALDAKGLALCGLAILGGGRKTEDGGKRLSEAVETFRKAREIAPHAGIVKRNLRLFDELAKCDPEGLLADLREVVEGK